MALFEGRADGAHPDLRLRPDRRRHRRRRHGHRRTMTLALAAGGPPPRRPARQLRGRTRRHEARHRHGDAPSCSRRSSPIAADRASARRQPRALAARRPSAARRTHDRVRQRCFDLLHVGHVRYLQGAAQEADAGRRRQRRRGGRRKGAGRPLLPAASAPSSSPRCAASTTSSVPRGHRRAAAALLRPDVHCKGTDYTVDTVPERDTVRAYGGRVAIVGDPKDHSTRDLLARLRRANEYPDRPPRRAGRHRPRACCGRGWGGPPRARMTPSRPPCRVRGARGCRSIGSSGWSRRRRAARGSISSGGCGHTADVALDFQGLMKSAVLARGQGAARGRVFDLAPAREGRAAVLLGRRQRRARTARHRQELSLLSTVGVSSSEIVFPLQTPSPALEAVSATSRCAIRPDQSGAAWPTSGGRGAVRGGCLFVRDVRGLQPIVLWGPAEETLAHEVVAASGNVARMAPATTMRICWSCRGARR